MIFLFGAKVSDICNKHTLQKVLNALPLSKQEILGKIKAEEVYHTSLAGYALLQKALQKLGFEKQTLADIIFHPHKKPFFQEGPDFNISHSHDRVVCAVSAGAQIGVDMEKEVSLDSYQLKKYFNEEELHYIDKDKERFYEVWTRKEAILKAANSGLMEARKIRFYGTHAVFAQVKWHLYTFNWDDYRIAIASSREQQVEEIYL